MHCDKGIIKLRLSEKDYCTHLELALVQRNLSRARCFPVVLDSSVNFHRDSFTGTRESAMYCLLEGEVFPS